VVDLFDFKLSIVTFLESWFFFIDQMLSEAFSADSFKIQFCGFSINVGVSAEFLGSMLKRFSK